MDKSLVKIFLLWLALLLVVGFFSTHLSIYEGGKCNVKNQLPYYRWDSFWYTSISRHGYDFSEIHNSSIAFFPLYPLVIRATHAVIHSGESHLSFILNIIFSLLAIIFLYRLMRLDYDRRTSLIVVAVIFFFPPAYFFLSGYPDILFMLLAILSFYFSRKKEWGRAGLSAGLLAITKPYGIMMLPVILLEYLWSHDWDYRIFFRKFDWCPLTLPLVTFGGFLFFNYWKFGSPVAFLLTQKTWGRSLVNPFLALILEAKHYLFGGHILSDSNFPYVIYLASFVFSLVAFFLGWSRVRKTYLLFSILLLISAILTGTLTSWGRYTLLSVAVLIGPAVYLAQKKYLFWIYIFCSALVLAICASFFVRCFPFE